MEVARQESANERHLREQAEAARTQMKEILAARDRRIEAELRAIEDREMRATQVARAYTHRLGVCVRGPTM